MEILGILVRIIQNGGLFVTTKDVKVDNVYPKFHIIMVILEFFVVGHNFNLCSLGTMIQEP